MTRNNAVNVATQTWVMVKYDIKKVLVTPGDIEFIFLEKGHQNFLPPKCNSGHVILEGKIQQSRGHSYHFESEKQKSATLEKLKIAFFNTSHQLKQTGSSLN